MFAEAHRVGMRAAAGILPGTIPEYFCRADWYAQGEDQSRGVSSISKLKLGLPTFCCAAASVGLKMQKSAGRGNLMSRVELWGLCLLTREMVAYCSEMWCSIRLLSVMPEEAFCLLDVVLQDAGCT